MKLANRKLRSNCGPLLLTCAFVLAFPIEGAWSQSGSDELNVVYRDFGGELSEESEVMAQKLVRKAQANGTVTLWVTLNYPFQTTFDEMTKREIAAQDRAVRKGLRKLLRPLVRKGVVSHGNNGFKVIANGCKIVATAAGVRSLVADKRVLHMVETRS